MVIPACLLCCSQLLGLRPCSFRCEPSGRPAFSPRLSGDGQRWRKVVEMIVFFFSPRKLAASCNFLARCIHFWSPPRLFPPQTHRRDRQLFDQEPKGSNTREAPYRDILVAVVGERGIETDISARDRPKNSSREHKSHKTFSKKFFT